ncbi:MAG: tRNA (guanosine(37)-N1)-methyltransferase TrmD [bacterium]|nr:tRNA (guanosine(37)-N1)-methyltransferase TrmD [bacterium]
MRIDVLTLFPEMFQSVLNSSIIKRAIDKGLVKINLINIRDYAPGKHRVVDDSPYGGGAGMVMKAEPIVLAAEAVFETQRREQCRVLLMSPCGRVFSQNKAAELAQQSHLMLICGHYEGVDERVREMIVDEDISIGDYILTGGELPSLVVIDSVVRLLPGVLGSVASNQEESFGEGGLLEYPQYTRPYEFRGFKVPDVLLSGNHKEVSNWRKQQAVRRTKLKRPDLLSNT